LDKRRITDLVVAAGLLALVHGALAARNGPIIAPDSHAYMKWADELLRSGPGSFLAGTGMSRLLIFRLLFVSVVAFLKTVLGAGWIRGFIVFNVACDVLLGLIVVDVAGRATGTRSARCIALVAFATCFDLSRWTYYVLSDGSYALLWFAFFAALWRASDPDARSVRRWMVALGLLAGAVLYRPNAIAVFPVLIVAVFLCARRPVWPAAVTLLLVLLVSGTVYVHYLRYPASWPFEPGSAIISAYSREFAKGEVIYGRPETYLPPPQSAAGYWAILLMRFARFFQVSNHSFSRAHNLIELAWWLPVSFLVAAGIASLRRVNEQSSRLIVMVVTAIVSLALFHAFTQIDFDGRYRDPILPHIIVLAAVGAWQLLDRWKGGRVRNQ
jgi:hypothetical protein